MAAVVAGLRFGEVANGERYKAPQVPAHGEAVRVRQLERETAGTWSQRGHFGRRRVRDMLSSTVHWGTSGLVSDRLDSARVAGRARKPGHLASSRTAVRAMESGVLPWGRNTYGQLGDGTTTNRWTPVEVTGMAGANNVAAGAVHSVAVRADRLVWGWGYNGYGRLGDGSTTTRHTPVWTRIGNKYYYLGGQRLAMRRYGVLYWLAGDRAP